MRKLEGLTILRFFAAFWVFIFHLNMRIPLGLPAKLTSIISSGAVAMPVFFMLSGFVLGWSYFERYAGFYSFFRASAADLPLLFFWCVAVLAIVSIW